MNIATRVAIAELATQAQEIGFPEDGLDGLVPEGAELELVEQLELLHERGLSMEELARLVMPQGSRGQPGQREAG